MNNYTLSIVLPVYQVEEYVEDCINSILKLEGFPYEVIVVDDGCKDNSINIIKKIIGEKENFRIIHQDNRGLSAARNVGLKYASGKYIWFVDSDDEINSEGVLDLLDKASEDDILIGNFYNKVNSITELNKKTFKNILNISGIEALEKYYLKQLYTVVWRYLYKREFLIKNNLLFLEGITFEDVEWQPRTLFFAKKILITNLPIYIYRKRSESIVNSKFSSKKYNDIITVSKSLIEFTRKTYSISERVKNVIFESIGYFLLLAINGCNILKGAEGSEAIKLFLGLKHSSLKYRGIKLTYRIRKSLFFLILKKKFH